MKLKRHKGRKPIEILNDYLSHIYRMRLNRVAVRADSEVHSAKVDQT